MLTAPISRPLPQPVADIVTGRDEPGGQAFEDAWAALLPGSVGGAPIKAGAIAAPVVPDDASEVVAAEAGVAIGWVMPFAPLSGDVATISRATAPMEEGGEVARTDRATVPVDGFARDSRVIVEAGLPPQLPAAPDISAPPTAATPAPTRPEAAFTDHLPISPPVPSRQPHAPSQAFDGQGASESGDSLTVNADARADTLRDPLAQAQPADRTRVATAPSAPQPLTSIVTAEPPGGSEGVKVSPTPELPRPTGPAVSQGAAIVLPKALRDEIGPKDVTPAPIALAQSPRAEAARRTPSDTVGAILNDPAQGATQGAVDQVRAMSSAGPADPRPLPSPGDTVAEPRLDQGRGAERAAEPTPSTGSQRMRLPTGAPVEQVGEAAGMAPDGVRGDALLDSPRFSGAIRPRSAETVVTDPAAGRIGMKPPAPDDQPRAGLGELVMPDAGVAAGESVRSETPALPGSGGPLLSTHASHAVTPAHPNAPPLTPAPPVPTMPDDMARQLASVLQSGPDQPIEVTLAPEELGRVRMVLNVAEDGVRLVVQAERPETADLMRRHADQLARDFREMGYGQVDLSFEASGQQHRHPPPPPSPDQGQSEGVGVADRPRETYPPSAQPPRAAPDGRLDLRL